MRAIFLQGDDPYAGADMPSVRNAVAVLLALYTLLTLAFLPLAPPTAVTNAGWLAGGAVAGTTGLAAIWALRGRRSVTFNRLFALAYVMVAATVLLQWLAGRTIPYQLLFLVCVGCGAIHPARRALAFLAALAVAAVLPFALAHIASGDLTEGVAWTVLFLAVGLVLTAYVSYVRRQRLTLHTGERQARALAAAAGQRVRELQWITDATLAPQPLSALLSEVLERIVPALGVDHAAVLLLSEEGDRLAYAATRGSPRVALEAPLPAERGFARSVLRDRRPVALEQLGRDGDFEALLMAEGLRSLLAVPLFVADTILGVLYVATFAGRRFVEEDASFLQLVGARVALSVERSRLFESQHEIAETLQRSLLPDVLPKLPHAAMAARYLPGGAGVDVGGDWYDVIKLRDGRIALSIGDVVGRGLEAATLMSRIKVALEAYAFEGHEPAVVIERLHELVEGRGTEAIATVLYLVLDRENGTAVISNAGHLPPLLRKADGSTEYLIGVQAPPLGALPYARFEQYVAEVGREFDLLLFTDGLVEQRTSRMSDRLELLRQVVEAGPPDPESLCDSTVETMLETDGGAADSLRDDVALLAVSFEAAPDEGFDLEISAEPHELATIRSALDHWLKGIRADPSDIYAVKLATGEACANAIEHAYRPRDAAIHVEARCSEGEVVMKIRDEGKWREPRGEDRGRGLLLMRQLMNSARIETSDYGTTVHLRRRLSTPSGQ
jgi:serine phosphatase RsbU (regulator of sigma subunit)/anti-sigma regulatory factor (Ser/Thr protein kinase)